jgi:hypothetical protein
MKTSVEKCICKQFLFIVLFSLISLIFQRSIFAETSKGINAIITESGDIFYQYAMSDIERLEWNQYKAFYYINDSKITIYTNESNKHEDNCKYNFNGKIVSIVNRYVSYNTWNFMQCPDSRGTYTMTDTHFKDLSTNKDVLLQEIIPYEVFFEDFLYESEIDLAFGSFEDKLKELSKFKSWDNTLFSSFLFDHIENGKVFLIINESASYGRDGGYLEKYINIPNDFKMELIKSQINGTLNKTMSKLEYPPQLAKGNWNLNSKYNEFAINFIHLGENNSVIDNINQYSNQVEYYQNGTVAKDWIKKDKEQYFSKWPKRTLKIVSPINIKMDNDKYIVNFNYQYIISNSQKTLKGEAWTELILSEIQGKILIIAEKGGLIKKNK